MAQPGQLRRAQLSTYAVFIFAGLLFGAWTPHIPHLRTKLELSDAALGVMLVAPGLGSLLMMGGTGALCARFGASRVLVICLTVYAGSSLLIGAAATPGQLWFLLVLGEPVSAAPTWP